MAICYTSLAIQDKRSLHRTTPTPAANSNLTGMHSALPTFTTAQHNHSLPDPCTSHRRTTHKNSTLTRVSRPKPHPLAAAPPQHHISVLRQIGMTHVPKPHAHPYALRRVGQPQGRDLHKFIPSEWKWASHVNHAAMNGSPRNKQMGPAPPLRLIPTIVNCRYSLYLPPHTGALRTRYDTGNVPAETRHPPV